LNGLSPLHNTPTGNGDGEDDYFEPNESRKILNALIKDLGVDFSFATLNWLKTTLTTIRTNIPDSQVPSLRHLREVMQIADAFLYVV